MPRGALGVNICAMSTNGQFSGKVAIVTGGGTGLGLAIAREFAARGAKVVIASRKQEKLAAAAASINDAGGQCDTFAFDVRAPEQVEALIEYTVGKHGRIDILVNNAAGNFVCPSEKLSVNGWLSVVGIVLNGTWFCSSFAGRKMIEQNGGVILNVIATFAWTGAPGVVHSASAKAGVLAMTRTLAAEWGPHNIRVNALAPGVMVTENASKNLLFDAPEVQKKISERIPLRRLLPTEEAAKLAAFLCSEEAAYITGDVMTCDGGRWLGEGFLDLMAHE